jgi:predicted dehydrogenase
MRQVLFSRSGSTVVRKVPSPPCPPGGVLVRNAFSAVSAGTERDRVDPGRASLAARARERPDLVREVVDRALHDGVRETREAVLRKLAEESPGGYSTVGTVVEAGARVSGLSPGDVVACAGAGHAHHAEVVAVPRNLCAKVPPGVPLPAAAMTTIAAIALHAVRLAGVALGERVAVVGCGLVGQIACRLLHAAGAEVIALDVDAARVRQAVESSGADHGVESGSLARDRVLALTGGIGADHVLVTAAAAVSEPLRLAAEVARDRGTVTLVGAVPIELERGPLYTKELELRVSRSYGPGRYDAEYELRGLDYPIGFVRWTEQRNMECVLDLQARGLLELSSLVEEVYPVDRAAEAFARLVGPPERRPRGVIVLAYPDRDAAAEARSDGRVAAVRRVDGRRPSIGLIGPGSFATSVLVPALRAAGAQLEVAGGGAGPSAGAARRLHGFARVAPSAEDVISDAAVDAVVIATRHGSHARLARAALEAGKHVFCEKPLALSVEELDDVLAAARASGRVLTVGFNRRFSPLLSAAREFVRGPGGPLLATYRVSAGAIPAEHWTHDLEQGGGRVQGEVCHFVDSLAFVCGAPVTEVHATGFGRDGAAVQARDNVALGLAFADGSAGTVLYAAVAAPGVGKERLEVFGRGRIALLDDYRTLELHDGARRERRRERTQRKGHAEEVRAFIEALRTGIPPIPLSDLENVTRATIAAVDSLRTGLPQPVPSWRGDSGG